MSLPLSFLLLAAAPVFEPSHVFVVDGSALRAQGTVGHYEVEASGALRVQAPSPIRFELRAIARDGARCTTTLERRQVVGSQVTAHRACQVDERWTSESTGLEHEVVIHQRPAGSGALRVELHVDGPWHHQEFDGHVFSGPEGGPGVKYGTAWVLRADQQKQSIAVEHVPGGLELVIPESLLRGDGAFPLIIDPVIVGTEQQLTPSPPVDGAGTDPVVAWSVDGFGFVVWVDRRRGTETDLFGRGLDADGNPRGSVDQPVIALEGNQTSPCLVWSDPQSTFVLVYEQALPDGGTELERLDLGATPWAGHGSTPPSPLATGTAPSLAVYDGGMVMAYAPSPTTLRVAGVSPTGLVPIADGTVDAGIVHTAVAASETNVLVAAELYDEVRQEQLAVAFFPDAGALRETYPGQWVPVAGPDRGTSVLTGPGPEDRYVVTRASASGFMGWKKTSNAEMNFSVGGLATAAAAAMVWWGNRASVATISSTSDLLTLSDVTGSTSASVTFATGSVRPPHQHLMLSGLPNATPYAVWDTGFWPQVVGAQPSTSIATQAWPVTLPRSPEPQLEPHVALFGDAGVIAWRAGSSALKSMLVQRAPNNLLLGPINHVADAGEKTTIGRHDVGMTSTAAAVLWRESSTAGAKLSATLLPSGQRVDLWRVDAGVATPSDVGPLVQQAGNWFYVLNSFGNAFELIKLDEFGSSHSAGSLPMAVGDTSVALDCALVGECVVAFVRPGAGVYLARPGDFVPTKISTDGDLVVITHDEALTRYVSWRNASGYTAAQYDRSSFGLSNVSDPGVDPSLSMLASPGVRPVALLATSSSMHLKDLATPGITLVGYGVQPDIASIPNLPEPAGVVVYSSPLVARVGAQINARVFTYYSSVDAGSDAGDVNNPADSGSVDVDAGPLDAGNSDGGASDGGRPDGGGIDGGSIDGGRPDGGGEDAGRIDAGPLTDGGSGTKDAGFDGGEPPNDAGTSAGDAGPQPLLFTTQPCGCGTGAEGLLGFALLLWWRRRR